MFTTKDSLEDILFETKAIFEDHNGDTLLLLHDGSMWAVVQDPEEPDYFVLAKLVFPLC